MRQASRYLAGALALLGATLASSSPAYAGVDVFIGSATIPSAVVNQTVLPPPADASGDLPAPAVTGVGDGLAHLWVDSTAGTCVDNAAPVVYTDAQSCTWDQANDTCDNNDTVRAQGGTYSIDFSGSNGRTAMCTFRPATPSSTITASGQIGTGDVGGPTTGSSWITIDGDNQISAGSVACELCANITYDGINTTGGGNFVSAGTNVTLRNMDMCCTPNGTKLITVDVYRGVTSNFVVEYSTLRDQTQTNNNDHFECIYLNGIQGITLRGNLFYGCKSTGNVLVTVSGPDATQPTDLLVENNIFEPGTDAEGDETPAGAFSIQDPSINMPIDGCVVRNNIFPGVSPDLSNGTTGSGCTVTGNIGTKPGSCLGHSYGDNTWESGTCTGDNSAAANIVSSTYFPGRASHDWVPAAGWPGVDQASLSSYPPFDRVGVARYLGAGPDLGPYETG